jgi:ATP-binding cassette subfamily F protein 3
VGDLSGGERSRAALAKLVAAGVNVLILDEPTNHLDIWACDALEEALKEFEGTVIVVSHDRYFLNQVAELLIVFDGGRAQVVHGNYDTYERLRSQQLEAGGASADQRGDAERPTPPRPETQSKPGKRKRTFPYRKVEDLEADIAAHEAKVAELESALASTDLYRDAARVRDAMTAFEDTKAALQRLYAHWEEAVELN